MPDIEQDTVISNHWPLSLTFYNRDKKLIRDISKNSRKNNRQEENKQSYQIKRITYLDAYDNQSISLDRSRLRNGVEAKATGKPMPA